MQRTLLAIAIVIVAGAVQGEEPAGAKELFAGGLDRTVVAPPQAPERADVKPPKPAEKKPSKPKPFGLSCWIELVDAAGQPAGQVTPARKFKSGERIRLHFKGNADGYISIRQLGASGTSTVLFPDPARGLGDNTIRAGADHVLPSARHIFRFDDKPGTEKLLVVFAKKKADLENFEDVLALADGMMGSKDLVVEEVPNDAVYTVNPLGDVVVTKITLAHQ